MKFRQDLVEKVGLLLLTALVTGLLVPYVLKHIDEAKSKQQKLLEAEIARQAKVIEAQSELLDEITETLWRWRYVSIKVAYYGGSKHEEKYAEATKEYESQIWDVLNRLRNQISKSRRLASEKAYKTLVALYDRIVNFDGDLTRVVTSDLPSPERAAALTDLNHVLRWEMTEKLDEIIDMLAQELRLKAQTAAPPAS